MATLTPFTTAAIVVLSTEGAALAKGKPLTMKPVIAGFVLGVFLMGGNMLNERITSLLALLILIMAAFVNGLPILEKVTGVKLQK